MLNIIAAIPDDAQGLKDHPVSEGHSIHSFDLTEEEGWKHLVVLSNDHASTPGEVEGDGCLVASQVVDMKDNGLGQVLLAPPDDPSQARVHQPIPARHTLYLSMK